MFGLFKKEKVVVEVASEKEVKPAFEKVALTTQDIAKELKDLAQRKSISVKKLDFKILSYRTFCKPAYGDIFLEVTEKNRAEIYTEKTFLNPEMAIYQEFKIEVFEKESTGTFPIHIMMGANKALTRVQVKIKPQENVSYFEGLEGEILAEVDKKKAKSGILLGCMDDMMIRGVKKLISSIRVNEAIVEEVSFVVCRGYDLVTPGGEEVVYHYRQNQQRKDSMNGVKAGEVVLELRKEVDGRKGRSCTGELLNESMIELKNDVLPIVVGDDFEIEEFKDSTLYKAKIDGYVYEDKEHHFTIKDEYIVDSVSLKSTGDINVGHDKNVKITIKEDDSSLDAIGAGMKIDTSEIKVAGNVANSAEIIANKVEIEGQTHQSSKIMADDIKIHLHKGYAEGTEVVVDILEGGKIIGDIVRVNQLFGGEIEAKEVYIEKVLSNALVSASHHIEIGVIEGSGNKFFIDARVQRGYHDKMEKLNLEVKENVSCVTKLAKEVKRYRNKIKQEEENVKGINQTVKELKVTGVKPPAALILKLKDYQESVKKHNSLLKELKDVKIQNTSLEEELFELNASVFDAKIVNRSPWKEYNEVIYKLIDPAIEVSFLAKEGDMIETLMLKSSDEGEFQVKRQ